MKEIRQKGWDRQTKWINGKTKERKEAAELFNVLFSTVPLNDLS